MYVFQKVKTRGESKQWQPYEAIDHEPFNGENVYRLQMIDKDRTNAYSGLRSLPFVFEPTLLFPNQVSDFVYIKSAFDLKTITSVNEPLMALKYAVPPMRLKIKLR